MNADGYTTYGLPQVTNTPADLHAAALDRSYDARYGAAHKRSLKTTRLACARDSIRKLRKLDASEMLHSRYSRCIPDELWCMVWQDLPLADRISITRVCHTWRNLALGSPHVWSLVDAVMNIHHPGCDCNKCTTRFAERYFALRHPAFAESNLHFVKRALELGKNSCITLHVSDTMEMSDTQAHMYLGQLLKPHSSRLKAVYLNMFDNWGVRVLFDDLLSFPALRTPTVSCANDSCSNGPRLLASGVLELPTLEELVLPTCISLRGCLPLCTSLRTLSCTVGDTSDIVGILGNCPALSQLNLELLYNLDDSTGRSVPPDRLLDARNTSRRIPDITIRGIRPTRNEADILQIFSAPEIETLCLWYTSSEGPSLHALQDVAAHCAGEIVACSCIKTDLCYIFNLTLGTLKSRQFVLRVDPDDTTSLWKAWKVLGPGACSHLIVDCKLWPTLLLDPDLHESNSMTNTSTFSVLLRHADDLQAFVAAQQGHPGLFPNLQGVLVRGPSAGLTVPAHALLAVIGSLMPKGGCLQILAFPRIAIEGEDPELSKIMEVLGVHANSHINV
ncbi:hypothetical protein EXIGLDRAFT_745133 [Exidia glandulosa HHB12029]|uniref:F-box domain-containing protein n=1 Tax=Exidia glandulosa HHB12029 TaxID=1314781 RepID=A0A165NX23_EXIGL|nr:hypothetical protein EXIGLDRAFT_745133 [Exidia glandulosa HHB12029]